ncbi:hypothetical protein BuS5_00085 [Desulfosarcina sp. BuS5]|nr:hypothetical protein [Desulfosarcina sp. BuS5]WDN87117.1 hypothetical protein BuS5_00085 [Desulfosarcina sp. BuS5]
MCEQLCPEDLLKNNIDSLFRVNEIINSSPWVIGASVLARTV